MTTRAVVAADARLVAVSSRNGRTQPGPVATSAAINAQSRQRWKLDVTAAEDGFHQWLLGEGQAAYRAARDAAAAEVLDMLHRTGDLMRLTPETVEAAPWLLASLRMTAAPPLARDRLVALAFTDRVLVTTLEQGRLPSRMSRREVNNHLRRICGVIRAFLDPDLFGWVAEGRTPTPAERALAARVVADRRCDSAADQILRQAQRRRQYAAMERWLVKRGYTPSSNTPQDLTSLRPGSFALGDIALETDECADLRVDAVIQPLPTSTKRPVLIKAISGTDARRTSKRTRETAQLQFFTRNSRSADALLLLGGLVDPVYLRDRAAEGLDWVWEHRMTDLSSAGL